MKYEWIELNAYESLDKLDAYIEKAPINQPHSRTNRMHSPINRLPSWNCDRDAINRIYDPPLSYDFGYSPDRWQSLSLGESPWKSPKAASHSP